MNSLEPGGAFNPGKIKYTRFRFLIKNPITDSIDMAKASEFTELVRGASISQLGQLFDLDRRTVTDRLKNTQPSGRRNGFPIYKVSDIAELLVVGYLTKDKLSEAQKLKYAGNEKDHWDAQLKRQKYLENMNDLWRTEKVISVFADVFKTFREAVVMFADEMEHESGLSNEQIESVKGFCDALLVETREKLLQLDIPEMGDHDIAHDPSVAFEPEDDLAELGLA